MQSEQIPATSFIEMLSEHNLSIHCVALFSTHDSHLRQGVPSTLIERDKLTEDFIQRELYQQIISGSVNVEYLHYISILTENIQGEAEKFITEVTSSLSPTLHCVHFEKSTDFEFFCYPQSVWLSHLGYKEMMRRVSFEAELRQIPVEGIDFVPYLYSRFVQQNYGGLSNLRKNRTHYLRQWGAFQSALLSFGK